MLWNRSNYSLIQSFAIPSQQFLGNWKIKHFHCKGYILKDLVKETCHIHTFWAHAACKEPFAPPRSSPGGQGSYFSRREAPLRQTGKACAWAVSLHGLAFVPTEVCRAGLLAGEKILTPLPPSLWHSCIPPQRHREAAVPSEHWDLEKSAQVWNRQHKEAGAHCGHICTSALLLTLGRIRFALCCWKPAKTQAKLSRSSSWWDSLYSLCVSACVA